MSRADIEAVRRACEAWTAGDISCYRELYAPDVTVDGGFLWPEARGLLHGADAVIRTLESIMAAFERSELVPQDFLELGDMLVVPLLWRGVPVGGQGFVEQRLVCVYRFRGGRIVFTTWFERLDEALDALGLPRPAGEDLITDHESRQNPDTPHDAPPATGN